MACARLGDLRLSKRLGHIVEAAVRRPSVGFPRMMGSEASLEALYRFMNNRRVTPEAILTPHFGGTINRASGLDAVHVVHDSSEFAYKREHPPADMGYLMNGGRGFLGHFSMAVDPERAGLPLGLASVETLNRVGPRKGVRSRKKLLSDPTRESLRWFRGVSAARERLSGARRVVHVMDREADSYELFSQICGLGDDFVIRIQHNRKVTAENRGVPERLFDTLNGFSVTMHREVRIANRGRRKTPSQKRYHPNRKARSARLEIRAAPVLVHAPSNAPEEWPANLALYAIHIHELDPPEGEPVVDWKLLTTMEATQEDQVAAVVDAYRQRWVIEEYFKALKTGCSFTKRQFDSMPALLNSLAVLAPVAWRLLVLRDFGRSHPDLPGEVILSDLDVAVLKAAGRTSLEENPTLGEVMWAVASLGGHLKRNGPPGWQTLARGLEDLELMKLGWAAAQRGQTCDQS